MLKKKQKKKNRSYSLLVFLLCTHFHFLKMIHLCILIVLASSVPTQRESGTRSPKVFFELCLELRSYICVSQDIPGMLLLFPCSETRPLPVDNSYAPPPYLIVIFSPPSLNPAQSYLRGWLLTNSCYLQDSVLKLYGVWSFFLIIAWYANLENAVQIKERNSLEDIKNTRYLSLSV